jgi:hypothetical protein
MSRKVLQPFFLNEVEFLLGRYSCRFQQKLIKHLPPHYPKNLAVNGVSEYGQSMWKMLLLNPPERFC